MQKELPKIIAVVGATASGKSGLAHELAWQLDGELVSADSRQLYKGLDIGSAKDPGRWVCTDENEAYMVDGVSEHLVDILEPSDNLSAAEYQQKAFLTIDDVLQRGKLPVMVGGTGLYIQAVLEHLSFPDVAPNNELRLRLSKKSLEELQTTYAACDPVGALSIDHNNRRRLIRAIEVCWISHKPFSELAKKKDPKYQALKLAIELPREQLYMRINERVDQMLQRGLVKEVEQLLDKGVDVRTNAMSGIGYREVVNFLEGDTDFETMRTLIQKNTRRLAKRQLSWFRRDAEIKWVRHASEAFEHARAFLETETTG